MLLKLFLTVALVSVFSAIVQAQTAIAPKPPFTAKDLELGKQLIAKSHELFTSPQRPKIRQAPHEPFNFLGNLYFVGIGKDRKSTRLNSSHSQISYAVFCLKKKKKI